MTLQEWITFILVFVTGAFIGMMIYVTSFKPIYESEGIGGSETLAEDFSVIGKAYGGNEGPEYIRPSFRMLGNGEYTYLPGGESDNALDPLSGSLPSRLVRQVQSAASESSLNRYADSASKSDCVSYEGGFDYEYRIIVEGESFTVDTCQTELDHSDDLAVALKQVWDYLDNPTGGHGGGLFGGEEFDEWLGDWIASHLDPDYGESNRGEGEDGLTACTLEAKLCPDGSAVGRTGPNCEFAKCPGE